MAGEWISTTLFNLLHRMTDLDSLSQSVFNTQHHNIRWCNPLTNISHLKPFFNLYGKCFMHDVISVGEIQGVEHNISEF